MCVLMMDRKMLRTTARLSPASQKISESIGSKKIDVTSATMDCHSQLTPLNSQNKPKK